MVAFDLHVNKRKFRDVWCDNGPFKKGLQMHVQNQNDQNQES